MNESSKVVFGFVVFFIILVGIFSVIGGESFFKPITDLADSIGNLISDIIKIVIICGIIWFIYSLFNKKN